MSLALCVSCTPKDPPAKKEEAEKTDPDPEVEASSPEAEVDEVEERAAVAEVPPAELTWPTFQGDNRRTGFADDVPELEDARIRWSRKIGIAGYLNAPLVLGDLVVVPSSGTKHNAHDPLDGLHAFEADSGEPRWSVRALLDANGAASDGRRIVFTSDDTVVRAVDLRGEALWSLSWQTVVYSTPVIEGESVFVGDADGKVVAIDLAAGTSRWEHQLTGAIRGGLASDGEMLYAVSQGGQLVALAFDGTPRWDVKIGRPGWAGSGMVPIEGYGAPVVDGDRLIVPFARDTHYDTPALLAVSRETGEVVWRATSSDEHHWGNLRSSPALVGETLLFAEPYSGDVAGVHRNSGAVVFRKTVGQSRFPQYASPVVARSVAYVPRHDGFVYAVDVKTGDPRWSLYLGAHDRARRGLGPAQGSRGGWSSEDALYAPPALGADGTVFVGSGDGWLYAVGPT